LERSTWSKRTVGELEGSLRSGFARGKGVLRNREKHVKHPKRNAFKDTLKEKL